MKCIIFFTIAFFTKIISANSQSILDSAQVRCIYELSFVADSNHPQSKQTDILHLLIGQKFTQFFSYLFFSADSSFNTDIKAGKITPNQLINDRQLQKKYTPSRSAAKYSLFINRLNNEIFVTDRIAANKYVYQENDKDMNWEIQNDTNTINGFICQKAISNFKGREYIAWFTSEIPISEGPYKFRGLPGLILKIYDKKENYIFTCLAIEKLSSKVVIRLDENSNTLTSRAEFRKAYKAGFDNPWQSINANPEVTIGGRDIDKIKEMLSKSIPYNPIELE